MISFFHESSRDLILNSYLAVKQGTFDLLSILHICYPTPQRHALLVEVCKLQEVYSSLKDIFQQMPHLSSSFLINNSAQAL